MTKNNFELTIRQRKDLMDVYRNVAPHCHSQREAWKKVVSSPAPRYYVSSKQAWEHLRKMAVGDFSIVDNMKAHRRRMYYSLFRRMLEMSQRKEFRGKSLWFICQFLVAEPAPEFFMQPNNMRFIFSFGKKYGIDYKETELRKKK